MINVVLFLLALTDGFDVLALADVEIIGSLHCGKMDCDIDIFDRLNEELVADDIVGSCVSGFNGIEEEVSLRNARRIRDELECGCGVAIHGDVEDLSNEGFDAYLVL